MNITLALVLGAAGAILILVAAIGGGFSISVISMPAVGVFPRLVSFVLGGVLLFGALVVYDLDSTVASPATTSASSSQSSPAPTPDAAPANQPARNRTASSPNPVVAPIVAPDGFTINLFASPSSSGSTVTDLPDGQTVTVLCTMQGESVTSGINGHTSSLWDGVSVGNTDTVGFVPDVYVGTPTYQPTMPNCQDLWNADGARA